MGRRGRIILQLLLITAGALLFMGCPEQFDQANLKKDIKDEVDYATAQNYNLEIVVPENSIFSGSTNITIKEGYFTDLNITPMSGYGFLGWEQTGGNGTITFENDDPTQAATKVTIKGGNVQLTPSIDARPTIHFFTPFGTDIPLNAQFNVVMSEDIDPTTLTDSSIYIQELASGEKVEGTIRYENGVIKLHPVAYLKPFMPYTIFLSDEIKDTQGLSLASNLTTDQFRSGRNVDDGGAPPPEVVVDPGITTRSYDHDNDILTEDFIVYHTDSTNINLISVKATDTDGPAGAIKVEVPTGSGSEVITTYYQYKEYGQPISFSISDVPGAHRVRLYTIDPAGNESYSNGDPLDATELIFIYKASKPKGTIKDNGAVDVSDSAVIHNGGRYFSTTDFKFIITPIKNDAYTDFLNGSISYIAARPVLYRLSTDKDMNTGSWNGSTYENESAWQTVPRPPLPTDPIMDINTTFNLGPGEGQRSIFFQFQDEMGALSAPVEYDLIHIDTRAPEITASFQTSAEAVMTDTVKINLLIEDAGVENITYSIYENATPMLLNQTYVPGTSEISYGLSADEGLKTLTIKAVDGKGYQAADATLSIILDKSDPTSGSLDLLSTDPNDNAGETRNRIVNVNFSNLIDTVSGVEFAGLSNDTTTEPTWFSSSSSCTWELPGNFGTKTVYLSLKDKAGNTAYYITSANINFIPVPLNNEFEINGGADFTNARNVTVRMGYKGTTPQYRIWEGPTEPTVWNNFSDLADPIYKQTGFELSAGDGAKQINVRFNDATGTVGQVLRSHVITLDTQAPQLSELTIKGDGALYNGFSRSQMVNITASFDEAAAYRTILNNGTTIEYSGWQPLADNAVSLALPGFKLPDDIVQAGIELKDKAGNTVSELRNIVIDSAPPSGTAKIRDTDRLNITTGNEYKYTNQLEASLELSASDANTSPGNQIMARYRNDGDANWSAWTSMGTKSWSLSAGTDGERTVVAQFVDGAGNLSSIIKTSITLDTTAPVITDMQLNHGDNQTPAERPKISIIYSENNPGMLYEQSGSVSVPAPRAVSTITPSEFTGADTLDTSSTGLKTYTIWMTDLAGNKTQASDTINYVEPAIYAASKGRTNGNIDVFFSYFDNPEWKDAETTTYKISYRGTSGHVGEVTAQQGHNGSYLITGLREGEEYEFWIQANHTASGGTGRKIYAETSSGPVTGYSSDVTIVYIPTGKGGTIPASVINMKNLLTQTSMFALNTELGLSPKLGVAITGTYKGYSVKLLEFTDVSIDTTKTYNRIQSPIIILDSGMNLPYDPKLLGYGSIRNRIINLMRAKLLLGIGNSGVQAFNYIQTYINSLPLRIQPPAPEGLSDTGLSDSATPIALDKIALTSGFLKSPYGFTPVLESFAPDSTILGGKYAYAITDASYARSANLSAKEMYIATPWVTSLKSTSGKYLLLGKSNNFGLLTIEGTDNPIVIYQLLNMFASVHSPY